MYEFNQIQNIFLSPFYIKITIMTITNETQESRDEILQPIIEDLMNQRIRNEKGQLVLPNGSVTKIVQRHKETLPWINANIIHCRCKRIYKKQRETKIAKKVRNKARKVKAKHDARQKSLDINLKVAMDEVTILYKQEKEKTNIYNDTLNKGQFDKIVNKVRKERDLPSSFNPTLDSVNKRIRRLQSNNEDDEPGMSAGFIRVYPLSPLSST